MMAMVMAAQAASSMKPRGKYGSSGRSNKTAGDKKDGALNNNS